jgi:predicted Zn-ribbon and HTH transcriptional regulator
MLDNETQRIQIELTPPVCTQCGYELEWERCEECQGKGGWYEPWPHSMSVEK